MGKLKYVCDEHRHLICVPYSKEHLHAMAQELDIKRCWFHKNHYDIPEGRIEEITKKCRLVTKETIVEIIRNPQYADSFLSDNISYSRATPSNQVLPEHEVLKYNGYIR